MSLRIAAAALLLAAATPAGARPLAPSPEVAALREEIAALQVDRALALTAEQARALLPVLRRAAEEVDAFRARVESPDPALVAALTRARDELRAGGAISDGTRQAIRDARRAPLAGGRAEARTLRTQALAILTADQQKALRSVDLGAGGWRQGFPRGEDAAGAGPGRGPGRRLLLLGVLTSDPFLSLLEARAR
jgi:hypothetical protein